MCLSGDCFWFINLLAVSILMLFNPLALELGI